MWSRIQAAHSGMAPNVVPPGRIAAGAFSTQDTGAATSYEGQVKALLMPKMEGTLLEYFQTCSGEMTYVSRWRTICDITSGVSSALFAGVVHRDLKPENFLRKGHRFFLTDFGLSTFGADTTSRSARGTQMYMAPEVNRCLQDEEAGSRPNPYNIRAADVFSVGMTVVGTCLPETWLVVLQYSQLLPDSSCALRKYAYEAALQVYSGHEHVVAFLKRACEGDHVHRATCQELTHMAAAGLGSASQATAANPAAAAALDEELRRQDHVKANILRAMMNMILNDTV